MHLDDRSECPYHQPRRLRAMSTTMSRTTTTATITTVTDVNNGIASFNATSPTGQNARTNTTAQKRPQIAFHSGGRGIRPFTVTTPGTGAAAPGR